MRAAAYYILIRRDGEDFVNTITREITFPIAAGRHADDD